MLQTKKKLSGVETVNRLFLMMLFTPILTLFLPVNYETPGGELLSNVLFFLPGIIFLMCRKNPKEYIKLQIPQRKTFLLSILLGFAIYPMLQGINMIILLFTKDHISQIVTGSSYGIGTRLFLYALLPCLLEELTYRGIFYNEYQKISKKKAVFLSALLFALMHGNLNQFIYAFFMGCIFALLYEWTETILSPMIIHFIINGLSVTISYYAAEVSIPTGVFLPLVLLSGILSAVIMKHLYVRGTCSEESQSPTKLITVPLAIGILITGYITLLQK